MMLKNKSDFENVHGMILPIKVSLADDIAMKRALSWLKDNDVRNPVYIWSRSRVANDHSQRERHLLQLCKSMTFSDIRSYDYHVSLGCILDCGNIDQFDMIRRQFSFVVWLHHDGDFANWAKSLETYPVMKTNLTVKARVFSIADTTRSISLAEYIDGCDHE